MDSDDNNEHVPQEASDNAPLGMARRAFLKGLVASAALLSTPSLANIKAFSGLDQDIQKQFISLLPKTAYLFQEASIRHGMKFDVNFSGPLNGSFVMIDDDKSIADALIQSMRYRCQTQRMVEDNPQLIQWVHALQKAIPVREGEALSEEDLKLWEEGKWSPPPPDPKEEKRKKNVERQFGLDYHQLEVIVARASGIGLPRSNNDTNQAHQNSANALERVLNDLASVAFKRREVVVDGKKYMNYCLDQIRATIDPQDTSQCIRLFNNRFTKLQKEASATEKPKAKQLPDKDPEDKPAPITNEMQQYVDAALPYVHVIDSRVYKGQPPERGKS